ncbi:DUF3883 domain-containing protein [Polaribacter sp. IC063]|uniref:DUF3883 domain-containing protein n=1 Tax=Polaribacter sp. IC063 TaxID=57031 RepID=UPI0011BD8715|nr:DUF3883 domain-containing protein [Polaribacter sp. IC063]TXD50717.1 DUF3883 domain-containing protein [Polaribacter sp. IC063]
MFLKNVRKDLLMEAIASPNLLSDLAGLENYISESYNNRSFIELLQNADDSKSSKFKIIKKDNFLFVANNGRVFNEQDLESLCRSASSKKVRGETIGYRGIGFKSVVGFTKEVHIISDSLEVTFSKELTKKVLPNADRVPLIRIPHHLHITELDKIKTVIEELKSDEYSTIFIFTGVTAKEIELEFESFDESSLMFLKNITETEFRIENKKLLVKKNKKFISEKEDQLSFEVNGKTSHWLLYKGINETISFLLENNKIKKIPELDSHIYSFLPTEDLTGLGVLINSDFSTDPSRKHIIFDERTMFSIKSISKFILKIIEQNILESNVDLINSLVPYIDPRMMQFKKPSVGKYLMEQLINNKSNFFENIFITPNWLNIKDYNIIIKELNTSKLDSKFYEIEGFIRFIKSLGSKENTFDNISENINENKLSTLGCCQFSIQIIKLLITKSHNNKVDVENLKTFLSNAKRVSLNEIKNNNLQIDQSFLSLLIENGLTEFDIKQVFKIHISNDYSNKIFNKSNDSISNIKTDNQLHSKSDWLNEFQKKTYKPAKSNAIRWRSAEENTLTVLNKNGFKLEDVSKQNIGYDLEGVDPNGNEIQIEVKSITLPGQKFKLTNNEIAVAQEKKNSYYIGVVRQLESFIEIGLISNPVENLILDRQCVQWIWECSNYQYNPIKFEILD